MNQSNNSILQKEILKYLKTPDLHKFIIDYAEKHPEFMENFIAHFNPQQISADKDDYEGIVMDAFGGNTLKSSDRYQDYGDYGFDALSVAEDLKPLLDKADYFVKHKNFEEAIRICTAMIETIADEWSPDFDYDGEVQVIYDAAIDKLQKMLEQNLLSSAQKQTLFTWYSEEQQKEKHRDAGLNTSLKALEAFFSDTPEMLQQNINNIDERIQNAPNDYRREEAAMDKIRLLQHAGHMQEAETAISQYLVFSKVRALRVEKLMQEKQYEQAIVVITDGIKIAEAHNHPGTIAGWKDKLLDIYLLQNNKAKIISTAHDLFISGRDSWKYYQTLKKYIPQAEWPHALQRLLAGMSDGGWGGANEFKAEILIEHQMWDSLFALCKKANAESIEKYEKYLKPYYAKEIFDAYFNYAEKQALITDKQAYTNIARILKKMKGYEGGKEMVNKLLLKYRELYKRRKNMMEELKGV